MDEQKVASMLEGFSQTVASRVSENLNISLELKMLQMEHRIGKQVEVLVDKKIKEALGADPQDHRNSHLLMNPIIESYQDFTRSVKKTVIGSMVAGLLMIVGSNAYNSGSVELPPILSRDTKTEEATGDVAHD